MPNSVPIEEQSEWVFEKRKQLIDEALNGLDELFDYHK